MTATAQINFRIPVDLKQKAQKKQKVVELI